MWSDLSVRHLLALRAVAEEGTFGRAASRLGFTQSAVSQQVASLEQLVGETLFDRPAGPRPPRLTPAGEIVLAHAETVIDQLERAEFELDRYTRGVVGRLAIGTFQSMSARALPSTLGRLRADVPDVEVSLLEEDGDPERRLDALAEGDLDVAFLEGDVDPSLDHRPLGADPYVALVPAGHEPGTVDLAAVAARPLIGWPPDDPCGSQIDRSFERLGATPNYAFRSHDNGAIQAMVGAGVGIAIVPLLTVDPSDAAVEIRATDPAIVPRALSLVWPRGRTLSPIATRFVDIAEAVCAEQLGGRISLAAD